MKFRSLIFVSLFLLLIFVASSFAATNSSVVVDTSSTSHIDSTLNSPNGPGVPLVFNSSTKPASNDAPWFYGDDNSIGATNDLMSYTNGSYSTLAFCLDPYTPKPQYQSPMPRVSGTSGPLNWNYVTNGSLLNSNLTGVDWDKVNYILEKYGDVISSNPLHEPLNPTSIEVAAVQAAIWYYTTQPYGNYSEGKDKWQFLTNENDGLIYQYQGDVYNNTTQSYEPIFVFNDSVVKRAWEIINATELVDPLTVYNISLTTDVLSSTHTVATAVVTSKDGSPVADQIVTFTVFKDGVCTVLKGLTDSFGKVVLDLYKDAGQVLGVNASVESKYHTLFVSPEGWQQFGSVKANATNVSTFLEVPASNETNNSTVPSDNTNNSTVDGSVPINDGNIPVNSNAIVKAVSMQNTGVPVLLIAFIILLTGIGLYRKN